MKNITEITGPDSLDFWAETLEPAATILADPKVKELWLSGKPKVRVASYILRNHKTEVSDILLAIDDTPLTVFSVATRLLNLLNVLNESPEIAVFFDLPQAQEVKETPSGSVTANTEAND